MILKPSTDDCFQCDNNQDVRKELAIFSNKDNPTVKITLCMKCLNSLFNLLFPDVQSNCINK